MVTRGRSRIGRREVTTGPGRTDAQGKGEGGSERGVHKVEHQPELTEGGQKTAEAEEGDVPWQSANQEGRRRDVHSHQQQLQEGTHETGRETQAARGPGP